MDRGNISDIITRARQKNEFGENEIIDLLLSLLVHKEQILVLPTPSPHNVEPGSPQDNVQVNGDFEGGVGGGGGRYTKQNRCFSVTP